MSKIKYLVLIKFIFISFQISYSKYCYWNSYPLPIFASKTPYNLIRGDIRDSRIHISGCEPVSIWSIIRHGKRTPSEQFYKPMKEVLSIRDDIISAYELGKNSLCAQDVENLKNWQNNFNTYKDNYSNLVPEGYRVMVDIGKRTKQAFPELLNNLEENDYLIRAISGSRTGESAKGYVAGFNDSRIHQTEPPNGFDEMAPYLGCKSFLNELRTRGNDIYAEADKYRLNPEYIATKDRIKNRLGIDYNLTDDNITALYDICRYDSSGYDKLSPWCAVFTKDDLIVLEYIGEMRHYYRSGYGQKKSTIFGRLPVQNVLRSFREAKNGKGKKLTTYVSHAGTMDMIYATLGLFKDEKPLKADHRNPNRKWRSNKIATFSANIIAVLNRCRMNDSDEYRVVFYLNEEPFLSICKEGVCTWQEFEEKFTFDELSYEFCNSTST